MSGNGNVRAARLQLALALMDHPSRREEAEAEVRRALTEPGSEPPDWRLHFHLGVLAGDRVEGLSELIAAVVVAPAADAREPADVALALLDDPDAPNLVSGLDIQDVRNLAEVVEAGGSHPTTVKLAVKLLVLRGDARTAGSLISASLDLQIQDDPALRTANAVGRALELIEQGNNKAALALLAEQDLPPDEPAAAMARALALYGLDNLDEALQALKGAQLTFDIASVRALVWLRRAADVADDERTDATAEADRAASEAVRLEPSLGDGLLLRAQVTLEGTSDIEGGRRLLATAIHRLEGEPEKAWLWRVQRRVRGDDLFRYVALEIAAACGRRDELLAVRPEHLPFGVTTWLQDGALAELVAIACRDAERLDDAAEFFEAAANFYDTADEPDRALQARQALTTIQPTVARSLELAEQYWTASFRVETQGREAVTVAVRKGLTALDELNERASYQAPGDRILGAYLRGLLLRRAAQGGHSPTWWDWWAPLPWLLVAALDDPRDSYRAAHLAWALDGVNLNRSALHFAEQAFHSAANDQWVHETAIVIRFNWYGALDADTGRLLDGFDDVAWRETMRAYDAMLQDDLAGLRKLADRITFDALWARELRANVVTRLEGPKAAGPLWLAVLDEARREEPRDHLTAYCAALALGDIKAARQHIDAGMKESSINPLDAQLNATIVGLVVGEEDSLGRAVDYVRKFERPFDLRWQAHMQFPTLTEIWTDRPEVTVGLARLREAAVAKLDKVLSKPMPPLTVEFDKDAHSSSDSTLDGLVRELLQINKLRRHDRAATAKALDRLAAEWVREPIGPTLAAAVRRLTPRGRSRSRSNGKGDVV